MRLLRRLQNLWALSSYVPSHETSSNGLPTTLTYPVLKKDIPPVKKAATIVDMAPLKDEFENPNEIHTS